jgi:protocatechuate 3,4-dioxygenase beta subunit
MLPAGAWASTPAPTSVVVTPVTEAVYVGQNVTFSAVVGPEGAEQTVTWSVYSGCGAITTDGVFSSAAEGTAVVRATSTIDTAVYGEATVTVAPAPVVLEESGTILGRVTDSAGNPVEGASVKIIGLATGASDWLQTNAQGNYVSTGLSPGTYEMHVRTPPGAYLAQARLSGIIVIAGEITSKDVELAPGGIVSGRVTDEAGNPVEGAPIFLWDPVIEALGWAETDVHGNYAAGLSPGSYELWASAFWRDLLARIPGIVVTADVTTIQDVELVPGGTVSGQVTDSVGNPVAGARVSVGDPATGASGLAETDEQGDYITTLLLPGTYRMSVTPPSGGYWMPAEHTEIVVIAGETTIQEVVLINIAVEIAAVVDAEAASTALAGDGTDTQVAIDDAQVLHADAAAFVAALTDGAVKTDLTTRLADVQDAINAAQTALDVVVAEAEAISAVEDAEAAALTNRSEVGAAQVLHDVALELVDSLSDGADKTALLGRLAAVQTNIGAFVGVTGVTVTTVTATINVSATQQLTATVAPAKATNSAVTWASSAPAVATVDSNGLVTGVSAGTAVITVTTADGSFTANSTITVVVPAPPAPAPAPPAPAPTPPTVVEQPIVANQPTVVKLEGVVEVAVTAGAVTGEAPKISAQVLPATAAAQLIAAATGVGLTAASDVVVLTMTGGVFTAPVQLSLNFDAAKVAAGQVPAVFVYNERTGRWIYLGGEVGDGNITVTVNRFSRFAVFGSSRLPTLGDIANHWGRGSIRTLAGMAIVSGFPDGNFKPGAAVTRAEFVSMLTRALGLQAKPEAAAKFSDAAGWAQGAIGAAAEAGLIAGYADGTFGGSRQITRAEMAVILQRVVRKDLVPVVWIEGKDFADAKALPGWAAESIRTASAAGLVRGFQDGTFRPGSTATRAETATMLYRLVAER